MNLVLQQEYADRIEIDFHLYKDKYWRTFNRYGVS